MANETLAIPDPEEENNDLTAEELLPLVYEDLRRLAAYKMAKESPGHTLQATALVHESYINLSKGEQKWKNRRHFFAAAAEAMRRILVDRARRKKRIKHGGKLIKIPLDHFEIECSSTPEEILNLNENLEILEAQDPELAEVVKQKYFLNLKHQEMADQLGVSVRSIDQKLYFAKSWLRIRLEKS